MYIARREMNRKKTSLSVLTSSMKKNGVPLNRMNSAYSLCLRYYCFLKIICGLQDNLKIVFRHNVCTNKPATTLQYRCLCFLSSISPLGNTFVCSFLGFEPYYKKCCKNFKSLCFFRENKFFEMCQENILF